MQRIFIHHVTSNSFGSDPYFYAWHQMATDTFGKNVVSPRSFFEDEFRKAQGERPERVPHLSIALDRNHQPIGGIFFEFIRKGKMGHIQYLVLSPHWRGGGVGKRLVDHAEETIREKYKGHGIIVETGKLNSHRNPDFKMDLKATRFYERRGYSRLDVEGIGSHHRMPNSQTGSLYKGTYPLHFRVKWFTGKPRSPRKSVLAGFWAALAYFKGAYAKTKKSPRYPRTQGNIATRRLMNRPLSPIQTSATGKIVSPHDQPRHLIRWSRDVYRPTHTKKSFNRARRRPK